MVLLLLSCPKELFIELSEDLPHGSVTGVFLVGVGHSNSSVEHLHYKLCVVPFVIYEVLYLYVVREDQVVFLILEPVHLCDDLSHARSASSSLSLGVEVG